MTTRKIRLIFDARILCYYLNKDKNRSGILFVAINLLNSFAKNTNIEITLLYEYQMYDDLKKLIEIGVIPECCKLADLKDLAIPFVSKYISFLYKIKKKYPKGAINDNIFKKVLRFYIARVFRFYYKYSFYLSKFKKLAKNYDIYFSPCNIIPEAIKKTNEIIPYMLVHDIIPIVLKDFYKDFKDQTEGMEKILESINYTDSYFTVSENTKEDIIKYKKGINPEHFTVTYLGANDKFYPEKDKDKLEKVKAKYKIPSDKKFIFSLCTLEPRKNIIFGIKNFITFTEKNQVTDLVLVLGGTAWARFPDVIRQELQQINNKNSIILTGYVDDEDVTTLYSGAEMFIYPSLYEGFGMPVLEAMQCGCPVITSNVSSLPEVIGDAGIQINPKSDDEMIAAYEKMYFDNNFRNECKEKGLERAKQFSWDKCANVMYETFCKDLGI